MAASGFLILLVAGGVAWSLLKGPSISALDQFWAPVIASPEPIMLVIGGHKRSGDPTDNEPPPVTLADFQRQDVVAFADASTLARLTGVMMVKGKVFRIRRHRKAQLEDLREGPTVLIGAFNNDWTVRLMQQGRYRFMLDTETGVSWIADRDHPEARSWTIRRGDPYRNITEDWALVARMQEQTTGRLVVTAAGMSRFGTAAAGEFLSNPQYMEDAMRSAPKGWAGRNIQIVLATRLVGESSSAPRVVATYFW